MKERQYFVALGLAIMAGFAMGIAAGLSEPTKHDLEWETLVAGAAAIVGGFLAYRGATLPLQMETQRLVELHLHEFESSCGPFMYLTNPATQDRQYFIDAFNAADMEPDNDPITIAAEGAWSSLPPLPDTITNISLKIKHDAVKGNLAMYVHLKRGVLKIPKPKPEHTRGAIMRYVAALREHTHP